MKSSTFFQLITFVGIIACFLGCNNNPDPMDPVSNQIFRCMINGKPFTGVHFDNTLIYGKNAQSGDWGKRFDIRAENQAKDTLLILTFGEEPAPDSTQECLSILVNIEEVDFGNTASYCFLKVGNITDGFPVSGFTRLSKCDPAEKLVDGTFENISESLISPGDTIRYTDGSFENIEYRLIQ